MDEQERPDSLSDESLKIALPLVAVGAFVLALSFAFCCYLARCKHQRPKISGYKKVVLNRKKENPLSETKNESCPVCLEDFQDKDVLAICACGHVFHKKCLKKWLMVKPTCPMCMSLVMDHYTHHQPTTVATATTTTNTTTQQPTTVVNMQPQPNASSSI